MNMSGAQDAGGFSASTSYLLSIYITVSSFKKYL